MKLALNQGLSGMASLSSDLDRVLEAERLGYDSVWTSESYGSDAVTTATWIAARTQRLHVGTAIYNEVVRRYGYEEAASKIQDLYLAGRKAEAEAAVPDALVDEITLCGPRERIRERLSQWKAAGVTTLGIRGKLDAIRLMAEVAL
ncbi:MAG: hypothetical protein DMD87_00340 [Candidatus Rokuibacteriota bacterium]|nr:MAG: hypothetical protein DMD87_00340 [Candidatus Rokubacteria bacterium]